MMFSTLKEERSREQWGYKDINWGGWDIRMKLKGQLNGNEFLTPINN